jgi:D-xylose 1-dehydrogenase
MNSAYGARYPSLHGRVVFVSGGSSGIGAELVRAFAAQGSKVAFCGTRPDGGRELIDELKRAGHPEPLYAACDVRDVAAYQALLARVIDQLGPIQVLVNNAGRDDRHAMEEVTSDMWDERLALNLKHYFFAIQAVAPAMAAVGGGSIINMGSVSWMRGRPNLVAYTTAKAGILGLTRTLARELGARAIRVNAVVPGVPRRAMPEAAVGPGPCGARLPVLRGGRQRRHYRTACAGGRRHLAAIGAGLTLNQCYTDFDRRFNMSNMTIAIDDTLLREARIKAVHQGTSVNEICRQAIERYVREDGGDARARVRRLLALADQVRAAEDGGPACAGRDALYDEVLRERGLLK